MVETTRYEWLEWMDRSGPFLAVPVLDQALPQGLDQLDPRKRRNLRQAYDEWREDLEQADLRSPELHVAWIDHVLQQGLDGGEAGDADMDRQLVAHLLAQAAVPFDDRRGLEAELGGDGHLRVGPPEKKASTNAPFSER